MLLFLLYLAVRVLARLLVTSGPDHGSKDLEILVLRSRYVEVLVRESAVVIGATVLAGGIAVVTVARRRPE